jgi:hypothetical protein
MMRGAVLSLCDRTGVMVRPWLDAGYRADKRSETPMGFAQAVFIANAPHLKQKVA